MIEIPEKIRAVADAVYRDMRMADDREDLADFIALAIMAERERCAKIAETYARDASFDDSAVGAVEHNANQQNIAHAIRNP